MHLLPTMGGENYSVLPVNVVDTDNIDTGSYDLYMDKAAEIFQFVNYSIVCQFIVVFGSTTNIINMICFVKQGFKDPINVSLMGLAVADLGCLTTLIWTNICMVPAFYNAGLPIEPVEFQHLTGCVLHTTFTRLSGWITALITIERCLCITAPLKVKSFVTSKRVTFVVVFLFILLLSSVAPVYVVSKLDMKYYQKKNKTLIGIVYTDNRANVEIVSYAINNVFIPFGSFLVIIICTVTLVVTLSGKTKWRKASTTSVQGDTISSRNQKVSKMVIMISTLFVICFFPLSSTFIVMSLEPELSVSGKYRHHLVIVAGIAFVLESINSSINIVVYYRMSSKYRAAFNQLFNIRSDSKTKKEGDM